MILLTHIIIALSSVLYSAFVYISPSRAKLKGSYVLLSLTVISGTVLVIRTHAPLLQSCTTGLVFIGLTLLGILLASHKLAAVRQKID